MPIVHVQEGFSVAADPYIEPDRQRSVFDADLGGAGVLAFHVFVENKSGKPTIIRRSDMSLTPPEGTRIGPESANSAAVKVGESGSVVAASLAFGIVGALVAGSAEDSARNARIADYRSKEFPEQTFAKDQAAQGFVFFIPPPGTKPFDAATLTVRFVDAESGAVQSVDVPLAALKFTGAPTPRGTSAPPPTWGGGVCDPARGQC
ncbi:MAG: hypothetical protein ACREIB_07660 [Pseudomonadota bacterium]